MNLVFFKRVTCVFALFSLLSISCTGYAEIPSQQKFKSHRVEKGETVYSISKKYNISEREIYKLNPDAKKGIGEGSIIILPSDALILAGASEVKFKKHKVRRKETLFSIAQKYGISVDDIKKYNKQLYSKSLKKGERLQIPILKKSPLPVVSSENGTQNTNNSNSTAMQTHTIARQETKYGIARKYGITIAELEALNPDVPSNFPIGAVLNVPDTTVTESATIEDEKFGFYEVQPKEGFYRLKIKLGMTEEDIVALNPYAKEGLKEGMILKVPKAVSKAILDDTNRVDLESTIMNKETKKLAVLLPFQLAKVTSDSLETTQDVIKENRAMRIALDFYSGVLMATEFAKDKGISIDLSVHDTGGNATTTAGVIASNNFENVDAVIGPLLSKNVEKAASILKNNNIPIFSPLSNRDIKLTSNLFQTLPNDDLLERSMIDYLKDNATDKNVVIISDAKRATQKQALLAAIPYAKTLSPREKGFLYVVDIEKQIVSGKENWFVLESNDPVIISNVVSLLNGMPEEHKITLFTTDKNDNYDFDDVSNMHLAHLKFTFPSVSKSYNFNDKNAFLMSYKNKYGVLPNRFAVRGFDVTYDVILRLAKDGNVYEASEEDFETEYIENKFRYQKRLFSGYTNNALYILRYNEDLRFEVVK